MKGWIKRATQGLILKYRRRQTEGSANGNLCALHEYSIRRNLQNFEKHHKIERVRRPARSNYNIR